MENLEKKTMFSLGVFVLLGVMGFLSIIYFFSNRSVSGNQEFRVAFTDVGGISKGAEVLFAGKPVGSVAALRSIVNEGMADASGNLYAYELVLKVDGAIKIYKDDLFTITSPKIIGERVVHIIPRTIERTDDNLLSSQALSFGVNKDPVKQIGDFTKLVQDLVDVASEEIIHVSRSISSVAEIVEQSLKDNAQGSLANKLIAAADSLKKSSDRVSGCLENMPVDEVKGFLENLEEISSDIRSYGFFYRYNKKWKSIDQQRKLRKQGEVVSKE